MNVKQRRIYAALIDWMLVGVVAETLALIDYAYVENIIISIVINLGGVLFVFWLYINKDCLFGYESLGKKLMKLRIYRDGEKLKDKKILRKRAIENFKYLLSYPLMIGVNNRSAGDEKYHTIVKRI